MTLEWVLYVSVSVCMMNPRLIEVSALVMSLMETHGLLLQGWAFALDHSVSRAGCCHYSKKLITLSKHLVMDTKHDIQEVRNIILHEIAHALIRPTLGHGPVWRAKAIQIGCDGCRCHALQLRPHSHVLACVLCGEINGLRHRSHRSTWRGKRCALCAAIGSLTMVHREVWDGFNQAAPFPCQDDDHDNKLLTPVARLDA